MGVKDAHQVGMADGEPGPRLALQQLGPGGRVFPVVAEDLDGARGIGVVGAGGIHGGHRAAAEALQQLITGDARYRLHGTGYERSRQGAPGHNPPALSAAGPPPLESKSSPPYPSPPTVEYSR